MVGGGCEKSRDEVALEHWAGVVKAWDEERTVAGRSSQESAEICSTTHREGQSCKWKIKHVSAIVLEGIFQVIALKLYCL